MHQTVKKYTLKEKWIKICKYIQNKNFTFVFYIGHKTNFYPTLQFLISKKKNMQTHEHPPFRLITISYLLEL